LIFEITGIETFKHTSCVIYYDFLVAQSHVLLGKTMRLFLLHFDVIYPHLSELQQWRGNITLMKINSHAGCLMNERADELAEAGRIADEQELCPGPQNWGFFWLRINNSTCEQATRCCKQLPRNCAPNKSNPTVTASCKVPHPVGTEVVAHHLCNGSSAS
jgi:hypothetical protein